MIWLVVVAIAWVPDHAAAHSMNPAFLHVMERENGRIDVLFKLPTIEGEVPDVSPLFSVHCVKTGVPILRRSAEALVQQWSLYCNPVDVDMPIVGILGLSAVVRDAIVHVERSNGPTETRVLTQETPLWSSAGATRTPVGSYFLLGIEHILLGFDHLSF